MFFAIPQALSHKNYWMLLKTFSAWLSFHAKYKWPHLKVQATRETTKGTNWKHAAYILKDVNESTLSCVGEEDWESYMLYVEALYHYTSWQGSPINSSTTTAFTIQDCWTMYVLCHQHLQLTRLVLQMFRTCAHCIALFLKAADYAYILPQSFPPPPNIFLRLWWSCIIIIWEAVICVHMCLISFRCANLLSQHHQQHLHTQTTV